MDGKFPDFFGLHEGFPEDLIADIRLFSRPANALLLGLVDMEESLGLQLYVRRVGGDTYRRIVLPGPDFSVGSVVVSDAMPWAYTVLPKKVHDSPVCEYDLRRPLHRIHLPSGDIEELPVSSLSNITILTLLSLSDATGLLYLSVDVYSDDPLSSSVRDAQLAAFDPASGETRLLGSMGEWAI
jgi:hypothetical protein